MTRFIVVGNGTMAAGLLRILSHTAGAEVVSCIGEPSRESPQSRLKDSCDAAGIPYVATSSINDPWCVANMAAATPDYLVSANNFLIFRPQALAVPRLGIVNFHNGPLPRYGGVNACSWAIFNGESMHGVTWHLVDDGIDSGPILVQKMFPLTPNETAIGLVTRCIHEGIGLFETLAPQLVAGAINARTQEPDDRLYYSAKDKPFGGWFPWWESADVLQRMSRMLAFHPIPNLFYRPRCAVEGMESLCAEAIQFVSRKTTTPPGVVLCAEDDGIVVSVAGGTVWLGPLFDAGGHEIDKTQLMNGFGIVPGAQLLQRT